MIIHTPAQRVAVFLVSIMPLFLLPSVSAQSEPVVTLRTTVTGNQEQPKVLYIVPWQEADDNTLLYEALNRHSANTIFGHVERREHLREIEFLEQADGVEEISPQRH